MKQRLLLVVLTLCLCCIQVNAQPKSVPEDSRELKVGKDGFEWYRVCKDGKFGVEDKDGKIIIPCEFQKIRYRSSVKIGSSYTCAGFETHAGGSKGLYSIEGKCIIPNTRGYTRIVDYTQEDRPEIGTYYGCDYDNGVALCNAKGQEVCRFDGYSILLPMYEKGKFFYMMLRDMKWGVMDGGGRIIIEPFYKSLDIDKDGNFRARNNPSQILGNLSTITTTRNPFANNPLILSKISKIE